jgi:hypothetical protein
MTIEEIRDIPIAVFLARMGYEPARRRGDEYWYLAPGGDTQVDSNTVCNGSCGIKVQRHGRFEIVELTDR